MVAKTTKRTKAPPKPPPAGRGDITSLVLGRERIAWGRRQKQMHGLDLSKIHRRLIDEYGEKVVRELLAERAAMTKEAMKTQKSA